MGKKSCNNLKRLYSTPYQADNIICKNQYKVKMWSPCSKTKNFKMVTEEYLTKHGALLT